MYVEYEGIAGIPKQQRGVRIMSTIVSLQLTENPKSVFFAGKTFSYKDLIRAIPGSAWSKQYKRWEMPLESVGDALRIMPTLAVSSEVKTAFQAVQARNVQAVTAKSFNEADVPKTVEGLRATLFGYQAVGKAFLDTLGEGEGGILAFDMGLGKSLTSLAYFVDLKRQGKAKHLLVVCPSPLKFSVWKKEVEKWTDLSYIVIDGNKSEIVEWDDGVKERLRGQSLREVQYQQYLFGTDVLIMNYELFLHDMDIIPPIDSDWVVVLDEAHRIKNPKSQTTKNLFKRCVTAGRKVLGSGTPLENNVQEVWSLADLCRPGLLGAYYKFVDRYMELDFFNNPIAPKPQMMDELTRKLDPIMIRKTKKEALPDLPTLTVQDYMVEMTKEQKKYYNQVKEGILEMAKEGEFTYMEALAQLTRMQQVCDSPALLRKLLEDPNIPNSSGKLNELANIITDIDPVKHKFILFSQYREMTDLLLEFLTTDQVDASGRVLRKALLKREQIGYIYGGIKPEETGRIQNEFQHGNIQCVLMTTAGNYGLDLYEASYVICYDQLFNPQKMEQIYARAHRNGAKNAITAINLVTKDSYEEKKLAILERKRELFKAIVDKDEDMMRKLFQSPTDIMDLL